MTDRYIDHDETLIYGPYTAGQMRALVEPLAGELAAGVEHVATLLEHATEEMRHQIDAARGSEADHRGATVDKQTVLHDAVDFLGRFSTYLEAHRGVDRKSFFPTDGTARGEGKSGPKVLLTLARIATKLGSASPGVAEPTAWKAEADALMSRLGPVLAHASDARSTRRTVTPGIEAARTAWMTTYSAAKMLTTCVLTLAGQSGLLSTVFYDLQVPGNTRVTHAPIPGTPATTIS